MPASVPPAHVCLCHAWDTELSRRHPDNTMLHRQMTAYAATGKGLNDVEVWWRLSAVCLNHTYLMEMEPGRVWSQRALQHARRAVQLDRNHFQANLRLAMALRYEFLYTFWENLEDLDPPNLEAAFAGLPPLVEQLNRCITLQPNHWQVLLMESALHLILWHIPDYARLVEANAHRLPANFRHLDLEAVVHKLRRSYQQRPENTMDWCIVDFYYFCALHLTNNYQEAISVAQRFLKRGPFNYAEEKLSLIMQQHHH